MPRLTPKSANLTALALTAAGCLQMVGHLAGSRPLRGVGAALAVAPYPKVFSDVDGLETFASSFTLHWCDDHGTHSLAITPQVYSRLVGAYNRRNVYGAALAYGPRLPEAMLRAVFCFGFAPDGPLRREFGLGPAAREIAVEVRTNTRGRHDRWLLRPTCDR